MVNGVALSAASLLDDVATSALNQQGILAMQRMRMSGEGVKKNIGRRSRAWGEKREKVK